ncbi:MAG: hypothetical protein KA004_10325 [Verrucomicrobiales bacterium]|nr:hypothetical protein [Verrucomicrobiales bacterium]
MHRLFAVCLLLPLAAFCQDQVVLKETAREFILTNGTLSARIERKSGRLTSLRMAETELLAGGGGYWSAVGDVRFGSRSESAVVQHPASNRGERAEVACRLLADDLDGARVEVEMRYALGRGDSGIYAAAIWNHPAGREAFSLAEGRYAMKLNPMVFDFLNIDADRRGVMPSGADWDQGVPLAVKEARRLTTGIHAGKAEHKYDYSACLFDTPAYGWCSTAKGLGVWIVNPSTEYLAGGATKVELTGHLDVNPGGLPTLLNMWHGSHYGGSVLSIRREEKWTRVIGPFFICCNQGNDPDVLWQDALRQAKQQAAAWPFAWFSHPAYPNAAARSEVTGRLCLRDPISGTVLKNLLVGLSAADETAPGGRRGTITVDWQRDSKHPQFWTRAGADGRFSLRAVAPGSFTLHAIAENVLGEFTRKLVTVASGQTLELGDMEWTPQRLGRQVWEIGVPDRTAREFRHGDHFWQWGLFQKYPAEFPDDVCFVIGKSDPRKDWNYVHVPRMENGRAKPSAWVICFDLPAAPRPGSRAALRIGIAGSRCPAGIAVAVNDRATEGLTRLPDTGVMHRDGITGYWCERTISFDGAWLKRGGNRISLTNPGRNWTQGILYDYLRLELAEPET